MVEQRRAGLAAELDALQRAEPPDVTAELAVARQQAAQLEQELTDLTHGTGRYAASTQGAVARQHHAARRRLSQARTRADTARYPWERRRAARALDQALADSAAAETAWQRSCAPTEQRLTRQLRRTRGRVAQLERDDRFNRQWWAEHPDHRHRRDGLQAQLDALDADPTDSRPSPAGRWAVQEAALTAEPADQFADLITRLDQALNTPRPTRDADPGLSL